MAVDKGRRLAGQEHGGADQFLDIAPAAGRRPLFEPAREFRIVDQRLVQRGLEVARRDRIDLQAVLGPIGTHAAGQVLHRALGRRVGRDARPGQFALHRGDVDDLAPAAPNHVTGDGLTDIERARNIGGEQLVPFLDREILERRAELHAGIVDQDIDRAGISLNRLDTLLNGLRARHIEFGHRYLVPGGRQFRRRRSKLAAVAAVEDNFGAVFGKTSREREPDALRRTRDERPLAGQFEQFKCHVTTPC
jgi:hypothetical protein